MKLERLGLPTRTLNAIRKKHIYTTWDFLQFFPRNIISIFGSGSELYYEFAILYLRIYMMLVFFQNIQPVTIIYFSATGNHRQGLLVSLSRQGLFLIPLLLILPKFFGIYGVFYASPVSDLMAFVMSVSMVLVSFKNFDRMEQNDKIDADDTVIQGDKR